MDAEQLIDFIAKNSDFTYQPYKDGPWHVIKANGRTSSKELIRNINSCIGNGWPVKIVLPFDLRSII